MRHALSNAIDYHDLGEGFVMWIRPTTAGALIEVGVVTYPDREPRIVCAMPARPKFL